MANEIEDRIRNLAYPLWESAGQQYGRALDFWLMAEQMVLEFMTATARSAEWGVDQQIAMARNSTQAFEDAVAQQFPEAAQPVPMERVQELAYTMWEAAGKQYGLALDFWVAAEKHVRGMTAVEAAKSTAEETGATELAQQFSGLSAAEYLDRVRELAYCMWETAGRQYGMALDYWLQAEQQFLEMMSQTAAQGAVSLQPETPTATSPRPQRTDAGTDDGTGDGTGAAKAPTQARAKATTARAKPRRRPAAAKDPGSKH